MLNPFVPNAPFYYPLNTSENLPVFWCIQGVEKGCIGNKWVNQIPFVKISDAKAADVNPKSIVNFDFKSIRLKSLSYVKVSKDSITSFTFQIRVYFGCASLLLKLPDRSADTLWFDCTGMPPIGSWLISNLLE